MATPQVDALPGMTPLGLPEAKRVVASCNECGKKFYSVKAAESAAFGDNGCPKCGGADIEAV